MENKPVAQNNGERNIDRETRKKAVVEQREVEFKMAEAAKENGGTGVVVFLVGSMPTPLFLNPDDNEKVGDLYVLKEGVKLPEGLIPDEKANDPEDLSTVLGRVISMHEVLKSGAEVVIITKDPDRARFDDKNKNVIPAEGSLLERHRDKLNVFTVSPEKFAEYEKTMASAAYTFLTKGLDMETAAVKAVQIHKATKTTENIMFKGKDADVYVDAALKTLLTLDKKVPVAPTSKVRGSYRRHRFDKRQAL